MRAVSAVSGAVVIFSIHCIFTPQATCRGRSTWTQQTHSSFLAGHLSILAGISLEATQCGVRGYLGHGGTEHFGSISRNHETTEPYFLVLEHRMRFCLAIEAGPFKSSVDCRCAAGP